MSDPLSQDELNKLIGGGDKKPLTVDEIISQANTGELPKTVAKKRIKQSAKLYQNKDLTDEQLEPISQDYLNSIINPDGKTLGTLNYEDNMLPPQQGMGDLKVAEQNVPKDAVYESGILPQEETGIDNQRPLGTAIDEPTGRTIFPNIPNVKEQPSLSERLTDAGTQITKKGDRVKQLYLESQQDLMKGDFISYLNKQLLLGIESTNYLGGLTGFPTGTLPLEVAREFSPEAGQIADFTFGKIGDVGKYGMKLSPVYNLVDDETKQALDELGSLITQFAIPLAGAKLIKGRIESVPIDQVKTEVARIKQDIFTENPHLDAMEMSKTTPQHYDPNTPIEYRKQQGIDVMENGQPTFQRGQEPFVNRTPRRDAPLDNTGFKREYEAGIVDTQPTQLKETFNADELIDTFNTLKEETKFIKDPSKETYQQVILELLKEQGVKVDLDATGRLFKTEPVIIAEPNKSPSQVLIKNDVATYEPSTIQINQKPLGSERLFAPEEFGKSNAVPFKSVFLDKKFVDSKPIGDAVNILEHTKMERDGIVRVADDVTQTLWDIYKKGNKEMSAEGIKDTRQRRVIDELEKRGVIKKTAKKDVYEINEPPFETSEPIFNSIEQPPYPIEKTGTNLSTDKPFKPLENTEPSVKPPKEIEPPLKASNEAVLPSEQKMTTKLAKEFLDEEVKVSNQQPRSKVEIDNAITSLRESGIIERQIDAQGNVVIDFSPEYKRYRQYSAEIKAMNERAIKGEKGKSINEIAKEYADVLSSPMMDKIRKMKGSKRFITDKPFKPLENTEPTVKPPKEIEPPLKASNEAVLPESGKTIEALVEEFNKINRPETNKLDAEQRAKRRSELVDEVYNEQAGISRSANVDEAIKKYQQKQKELQDFDAETQALQERNAVSNLIYEAIENSKKEGYEYTKELQKDPRLASLKDLKDLADWMEANGKDATTYRKDIAMLERDMQRYPIKNNRLITDEMVAEADRIIRSSPDKIASNPADWYAKMSKAYLIKGARFIEDGVIAFRDWSKKMIQEFGTEIVPYLKDLYEQAKSFKQTAEKVKEPEITITTPKDVINSEAQKKYSLLKDKLINPTWTPEQIEIAKTLADDVLNEKINISNPMGKQSRKVVEAITKGVFDTYHNMVKYYGANGSEMLAKIHEGNKSVQMTYKLAYPYLDRIREISKNIPREERRAINQKVIQALENRANADAILGNDPIAREFYDNAQGFYDTFKGFLQEKNIPVVEDYFTRIAQADMLTALDEVVNASSTTADGKGWFALNDGIAVDTPFVKKRTGELKAKVEDPLMVMERYFNSMTKYIAYKDALDYYYGDFTKTMPRLLQNNNLRYANKLIKDNISPEYLSSTMLKNMRDNVYITALWNNPKATIFNRFQRWFTDFFIADDVAKMTTQNYLKVLPDNVEKLINSLEFELPEYMEISKDGAMNKYRKFMEGSSGKSRDMFRVTEQNNWKYSQVAGIIEAVKKFDPNIKTFEEVNKALDNPQVFQSAYKNAMTLSNRVQFGVAPFIRPALFKNPYTRLFAMFTRFKFGQWQVLLDTLRSQEGIRGLRAQNILRRGISEDVQPVELLREVETFRTTLDKIKSEYKNPETTKFIGEYIDYLKAQEKDLNRIIKEIEPLRPKSQVIGKWAEYYGILSGISFAWQMLSNAINYYTDDSADKPKLMDLLIKTAYDISPAPMYGTNLQGVFKNPLLPNTEIMLYGNLNWKGLGKESLRYLFRTTPLGIPDRLAFNIPQKKLSKYLFGKDEITNPRPIRQIQAEIDKEQDKDNPDPVKLTQLKAERDRLQYDSDVSDEYKSKEYERFKKTRERERKLDPLDFSTPEMDSLKFEQNYLLKQIQKQ